MKKSILKICFKPLTVINRWMKKDENLIFFYSNLGFRDNVRAFYEYLIEHDYHRKYKIVVSINDYEQYEKDAPENVSFVSNQKGISSFLKAKYAFYCFGKYPIKPSKEQTVVNLWHGTPLKKIGNLEKGLEHIDYNFFTQVLTASSMYPPIMAKIFGCREEQVEVLGNPRNDEMFRQNEKQDSEIRQQYEKVIVWLPTYREYDEQFVLPLAEGGEWKQVNDFLKSENCKMIVKLHPFQKETAEDLEFSNIEILTQQQLEEKKMSVYALLRNADGLITDYSSVCFDYMLLDRPLAFTTGDMEQYQKQRGFVFDNPKDYMAGMELRGMKDVKKFVSDMIDGRDAYREERHRVNDVMNYYKDGNSCRRIAERFLK